MNERGSAIIYIFIGIALFGALMFMFSRGSSQSSKSLTDEQASILASEIIAHGHSLEAAADRLLTKGCSEMNLSASGSGSCDIYALDGGKVKNKDTTIFTNTNIVADVPSSGNTNPDLIAIYYNTDITQKVCMQINEKIGLTPANTTPQTDDIFTNYDPTYAPGSTNGLGEDWTVLAGHTSGCFLTSIWTGSGYEQFYVYYQVLIAK